MEDLCSAFYKLSLNNWEFEKQCFAGKKLSFPYWAGKRGASIEESTVCLCNMLESLQISTANINNIEKSIVGLCNMLERL